MIVLIYLLVGVIVFLFNAWMLMLGIGVIHAHVLHAVLPCSFGVSALLTLLLPFGAGRAAGAAKDK